MRKRILQKWVQGITSIEAVIGVSIAGLVIVFSLYAVNEFVNSARDVGIKTQALYLAEDGLELTRYYRDNNWTSFNALSLNNPHYLDATTTGVSIGATPEIIDGYYRTVTLDAVYRDPTTDDIVPSTTPGSVIDSGAKYVTVSVVWGLSSTTVSLTGILANLHP